jgi:hypothetical protein
VKPNRQSLQLVLVRFAERTLQRLLLAACGPVNAMSLLRKATPGKDRAGRPGTDSGRSRKPHKFYLALSANGAYKFSNLLTKLAYEKTK